MDNDRVSLPITSFQSTLQHILYTAASSGTTSGSSHSTRSQTLHLSPHCRQQQHLLGWEIGVRACDSSRSGTGKCRTGPGRDCRLDESLISPASFPETQLIALAVWEEALSWWSRIHHSPVLGRFSWIFENTWGRQTSIYHFAVTVLWSSSTTVARWPLVEKKVATIFFPTLLCLLTLVGGCSTGKTQTDDWRFVSGSNWYIQVSSPVTMSDTRRVSPLLNLFSISVHHSTLVHLSPSGKWCGTHREESFLTLKCWCRMVETLGELIHRALSMSL